MTGMRTLAMAMIIGGGLTAAVVTAQTGHAEELTIGAAPTLKPAFQKIIPMFEREYGATVRVVYGPSHTLRRQIEKGAPIDVFLPDDMEEAQYLEQKGLTLHGGVRLYAQTSLVLVMSAASDAIAISFRDALPNRTRIALGDPKTTALGKTTARVLTGFAPVYKNRSSLLQAPHSDGIVNLIRTGAADVGIVYRVDAINNGHLRIVDETPAGANTSVQFGGAVVWTCREASLNVAEEFVEFLMTPRIQKLLVQYGFDPVTPNRSGK